MGLIYPFLSTQARKMVILNALPMESRKLMPKVKPLFILNIPMKKIARNSMYAWMAMKNVHLDAKLARCTISMLDDAMLQKMLPDGKFETVIKNSFGVPKRKRLTKSRWVLSECVVHKALRH